MTDPQAFHATDGPVVIIGLDATEYDLVHTALLQKAKRLTSDNPQRAQECEFLAHRLTAVRSLLNKDTHT